MGWTTPGKGDRFTHPLATQVLTCDRLTKTPDGEIWLWCQGQKFALHECQPVGFWKALLRQFVLDLEAAQDWPAVISVTDGLDDSQKAEIWIACTDETRAKLRSLKDAQAQAA